MAHYGILAALLLLTFISAHQCESHKEYEDVANLNDADFESFLDDLGRVLKGEMDEKELKEHSMRKGLLGAASSSVVCASLEKTFNVLISSQRTLKVPENKLIGILKSMCKSFFLTGYDDVCSGLVSSNLRSIIYILDHTNVTAAEIRDLIYQKKKCTHDYPEIRINIPEGTSPARKFNYKKTKPLNILQITDVHYDPLYQPDSNGACGKPICCQFDSRKKFFSLGSSGAGYWTDYRNCDVPLHFIQRTFQHIAENHEDIDYIYFSGDIVSHRVWDTSVSKNIAAIRTFYDELLFNFGDYPVIPILGNHEPHPFNVFAPHSVGKSHPEFSTQWLFDEVLRYWKHWLPKQTYNTIRKGGYYTVLLRPGFRVIALNNNVAYTFNYWLLYDNADPYGQLQWLADTLLMAERDNESVHVVMHMPTGEEDAYIPWAKQFARIVERFSNTITGMFYGHTHFAEMNLYTKENAMVPTSVGYNGGSLTPYTDVNPNYRMYIVDSSTFDVIDFDEYVLNLTQANNRREFGPMPWNKLYSFREQYDVPDMSPKSIFRLLENIASSSDMRDQYFRNKVRYGEPSLKKGCKKNCHQENVCKLGMTVFNDIHFCEYLKSLVKK